MKIKSRDIKLSDFLFVYFQNEISIKIKRHMIQLRNVGNMLPYGTNSHA